MKVFALVLTVKNGELFTHLCPVVWCTFILIKQMRPFFNSEVADYTPGIYAEGYIVFVFPFVHLYVRSFVCSFFTFRHVRRIYLKAFG